jgi:phage terminase large subunit-like protein
MLITKVTNSKYKPLKKAIDVVYDVDAARRVYLCKKSSSLFFIYYMRKYIKYKFADFHWEMFHDLDLLINRDIRELAWFMHRESIKTSAIKAHIIRRICYNEKKFINVDSYDVDNAEQILFDVVIELQTNQKIIADFGELYNEPLSHDRKTKKRVKDFITANGIRVSAYSTQESVRGRAMGENRPDELILDDFETYKTIASKATTESIEKHMKEFYGGLAPDYSIIYLGNYISEFANIQKIIDRAKKSNDIIVRMVGVAEEMDGKIYWESKYVWTDKEANELNKYRPVDKPMVSLETKKRMLGDEFWGDMMNMPYNSDKQEFTRDMFNYIDMDELKKKKTSIYVIFDPAGSKRKQADSTGVTICWVDQEGRRYLKSYKLKLDSKEILNHIFYLHNTYRPIKFFIEEGMYMLVIKPFIDEEMRERNQFIIIENIKHNSQSKETRIRGLIPGITSNNVYFIRGETSELEDELLRFPTGSHDDVADSAAYTLQIVVKPKKEEDNFDYSTLRTKVMPGNS